MVARNVPPSLCHPRPLSRGFMRKRQVWVWMVGSEPDHEGGGWVFVSPPHQVRHPIASLLGPSLRAASRSGLRSLKSIHWIDFWPSATTPKPLPPRGEDGPRACLMIRAAPLCLRFYDLRLPHPPTSFSHLNSERCPHRYARNERCNRCALAKRIFV